MIPLTNQCIRSYETECVRLHNSIRAKHSSPNLVLNQTLAQTARNYSNFLAITNTLNISKLQDLGENLAVYYMTQKIDQTKCNTLAKRFVHSWYEGVKYYNFTQGIFTPNSGFFTQLVWRATTQIGCGLAINNENKVYGVAYYFPQGNILNKFKQNVLKEKLN